MAFKIYVDVPSWTVKQAEYHTWMQVNVAGYTANQWAKEAWCKHPDLDKWHVCIPTEHEDEGEELTEDWEREA